MTDDRFESPESSEAPDLGALVDGVLDDPEKFAVILRRAFPGAQPEANELRARWNKLRRAELEPELERLGSGSAEPGSLDPNEQEAARLQAEAQGRHTIYSIRAHHHRSQPFESNWVGDCQSVRVTLPKTKAEGAPIWTHLGVVKPSDHLAFSIEEIVAGYTAQFGTTPKVGRLDLVTGARHFDLDRFSPISLFLAFTEVDDLQPSFFVFESGSAQGNPEVLYFAPEMGATIHCEAGFQFTPFACDANWYTGQLTMNAAGTEPSLISISIAQERDGQRHYLDLSTAYEVSAPGRVVWPVTLQIQAALRVFAIAQGMGCKLALWEWGLGEVARVAFDWIAAPPERGTPEGYSGCTQKPQ